MLDDMNDRLYSIDVVELSDLGFQLYRLTDEQMDLFATEMAKQAYDARQGI